MKKLFLLLSATLPFTLLFGQSNWLDYRPVRSIDFIGKAVRPPYNPATFEITPNPLMDPPSNIAIILDSSKSASYTYEFIETFKKFSLPFFTKNSLTVDSMSAVNVVYHSLNIETLTKLKPGQYYVYSGLSADTVNLRLKYSKQRYFGFGKAADTVSSIIKDLGIVKNPLVNGIIDGAVKLIDGGETKKGDSAFVIMKITDRNVLYKVQALMYSEISNIGSKNLQYLIWKGGNAKPEYFTYPDNNTRGIIYVPFSKKAKKVDPNISYGVTLVYDKDPLQNNSLNLGMRYIQDLSGKDTTIFFKKDKLEIPNSPTLYFWNPHIFLGDVPAGGSIIKKVYFDLYAEEATPNPENQRPRILLYHKNNKQPRTYLRYPELTVTFLR